MRLFDLKSRFFTRTGAVGKKQSKYDRFERDRTMIDLNTIINHIGKERGTIK